jgi:hypothetical protein
MVQKTTHEILVAGQMPPLWETLYVNHIESPANSMKITSRKFIKAQSPAQRASDLQRMAEQMQRLQNLLNTTHLRDARAAHDLKNAFAQQDTTHDLTRTRTDTAV